MKFNNATNTLTGAMMLRVALGVTLLAHGLLKVMVFTVAGAVGYFESLGIPAVIAYLTIGGEILGGAALILGVFTRLTAMLSIPILVGATYVHWSNGWVFSNQGGGWEFPLMLSFIAIIVAFQGAGRWALFSETKT